MNHSGDAAEQVVRISLEGMEVALRIAGAGAKNIVAFLLAALKSDGADRKTKLKGKERLANMLKSGKELKIFAIKNKELEPFAREAKRYGVVYCALKEKKGEPDGLVDIMVKAEDASKISRIMERLQFAAVDRAAIESQIQSIDNGQLTVDNDEIDQLLDQLIDENGRAKTDEPVMEQTENPTQARTAESPPSVSRSGTPSKSANSARESKKPDSVHEFLQERTAQNAKKREEKQPDRNKPETKPKTRPKPPQHQPPPNRGRKKSKKERGS